MTVDTDKPFDLTLYEPPFGPDILTAHPCSDLAAALAVVATTHAERGAVVFRVAHRETADLLVRGETRATPNADAYEAARRGAAR